MSYFIVLLFILLVGIDMAYLFKRGFGQTAAVANFIVIFALYLGGLFADMSIAMYMFLAFSVLLTAFTGYKVVRSRDIAGLRKVVANPAFYLYALTGFALGVAFLKFIPTATDELTHWALCVKNMFTYDNFGNIGNTTTMFNQYVPATGIFMYAFQIFGTEFSCGALYAAFDLLLISMLLPVMELFKKKLSIPCLLTVVISAVVCILFKPSIFNNLLVDGLLGVMMAYIYLAYRVDRDRMDGFTVTSIALGCFVVTMTKSSGIALAIFAIIFIAIDMLTVGRDQAKEFFKEKTNIVYALLPVVLMAFGKMSWSWYVDFYGVRAGWDASEMTLPNILEWIKNPTPYQTQVTSLFFKTLFVGKMEYQGGLQVPAILTILLIAGACVGLGFKTKNKAYAISYGVVSVVIVIGYGISLLLLYIFSFAYWEGLTLASYARYSMTILLALTLIYICQFATLFTVPLSEKRILPEKVAAKIQPKAYPIYATAVGVFSFVVALGGYFISQNTAKKTNAPYVNWCAAVDSLDKNESVYIVVDDSDIWQQVFAYLRMRFIATPMQTSGYLEGGSYTDGREAEVCYTGNPFSMDMTAEELCGEMSGYTHVYLYDVPDGFEDKYSELFDGAVTDDTLYRIVGEGENIKLVKA